MRAFPAAAPAPPGGDHALTITIHFAGAAEPDPGTGAYGAVVAGFYADGGPDRLYSLVPVAHATGDECDWYGLREGLDSVAGRLRYVPAGSTLTILGHARHVIDQLNGKAPAADGRGVAALRDECRQLLDKIVAAGCRWSAARVPPERNQLAARLSAEAWGATTGKPLPHRAR